MKNSNKIFEVIKLYFYCAMYKGKSFKVLRCKEVFISFKNKKNPAFLECNETKLYSILIHITKCIKNGVTLKLI